MNKGKSLAHYIFIVLMVLVLNCFASQAFAVGISTGKESDKKDEKEDLKDPFYRDNPHSMIAAFLKTLAEHDYERSANYLNLDNKSKEKDGAEIAKQMHNLLDQSGWIRSIVNITNDPKGNVDDDLPLDEEKVGGIRSGEKLVPLLIERMPAKGDLPAYWVFSSETIEKIIALPKELKSSGLDQYLPKPLINQQINGVPIGHWMMLIVLAGACYTVIWALTNLLRTTAHLIRRKVFVDKTEGQILQAFFKPLRLYLSVWISVIAIRHIGVSMLARQTFSQVAYIIGWVSLAWIVWRLIDVFAVILRNKLMFHNQYSLLSAVVFFRRGTKVTLMCIVLATIMEGFGFEITTWLAALGIGGIALALGAQKTVENFVGSLTLIADRPIAIGDFCKFGDAKGTVEDIGMRSTRIRTADRTLVSIPNGDFSSMQIENYSKRDSFLFNPVLTLSHDTNSDQIKCIMAELRKMLSEESHINHDSIKVHFIEIGSISLNIEVSCYIAVRTVDESAVIKSDLNLKIMDIVKNCGTSFAVIPTPAKI